MIRAMTRDGGTVLLTTQYCSATGQPGLPRSRYGVDDLERALDGLRGPVYVHVDLDVLEPTVFGSTCYPEPDGVQPQRLIDLIPQVDDIVGAAITEHAPSGDDVDNGEAEVIRWLGAALAR
jgi:arginase